MRQTKFRGWSSIENKWVYGSLLQSEIDVNELSVKCQIHERFADDFSIAKHDVIPKSVGQFTGLLDKKLKEIYEKDILDNINYQYKVIFENGCFYLYHTKLTDYDKSPLRWGAMFRIEEINMEVEIIGNIFENKDLINV